MNGANFKEFSAGLTLLSRAQRQRVLAFLQATSAVNQAVKVIEASATARSVCSHCACTEAVNLRAGVRTHGALHVQNVNAYHRRFHQWLNRFNGVATRYLCNYLSWRQMLDAKKVTSSETLLQAAMGTFHV